MKNTIWGQLKKNKLLVLLCLVLILIIAAICVVYINIQTENIIENYSSQLGTLADLKTKQITLWRQERIVDGYTIQTDEAFSKIVDELMASPKDIALIQETQDRLHSWFLDPNYSAIFLVNASGKIIIQIGDLDESPGRMLETKIIETNLTHQITMTDLYLNQSNQARMDLIIPVYLPGRENQPALAFLVYLINPEAVLFPLIQTTPANYLTVETLIVRKEAGNALFLNELRFMQNTALTYSIPLTEKDVPAVMAIEGVVGVVEGLDYRGNKVMAYISTIPDTDWKLIAKMDRSEIYKPITRQNISIALSAFLVSTTSLILILWAWRRQSAEISKGLVDSERKRRAIETKYSLLFNQANDAILLMEENGKITDVNDRAVDLYGYSKSEFLRLSISDLREEKSKDQLAGNMESVKTGKYNVFQTCHRRKDGTIIFVDVSSRFVTIDNTNYFQSIIRDITEKKNAEDRLRRSEEALNKAQQVSHVGSWFYDVKSNRNEISSELCRIFGFDHEVYHENFYSLTQKWIHPDDYDRVTNIVRESMSKKLNFSYEMRIVRPDGLVRDIWVESGEIVKDENDDVVSIYGIVQDNTDKKKAEKELRKSENLLQRIYDLLPVGLWITDDTGRLIRSNKMIKEIWGKDILVATDEFAVFHGRRLPSRKEIQPDDWASVHTIKEGVTIRDEMIEIDAYDGKTKTILNYSTPILDENGRLEGSIILNLDITELKKAEEQLTSQLDELRRWNSATLGRENRILELKAEINDLLEKCGQPKKYMSVEGDQGE